MCRLAIPLRRWAPALLLMLLIFGFSSIPSAELPSFGTWDYAVKKGSHALGYGALGLAYWRALLPKAGSGRIAWLMAVLYSLTDEFHQSLVPGRHPSAIDVGIDSLAVCLSLAIVIGKSRGETRSSAARSDGGG
jgi:VanZ family protein